MTTPSGKKWVPDSERPRCVKCNARFTMFLRQHHCRYCGEVFCHDCSGFSSPMPGKTSSVRVCEKCFDVLNGDSDDVPTLTSVPESKRKKREEFRLKTCRVVRWSHGEKYDLAIPASGLHVGDNLDLGDDMDETARVEIGVALPNGEHTQTNFSISDVQQDGRVELKLTESDDEGILVLDVTSFGMTSTNSKKGKNSLLRIGVLVGPLFVIFVLTILDFLFEIDTTYVKTAVHFVRLPSPLETLESSQFTILVYGISTGLLAAVLTATGSTSSSKCKGPVSMKIVSYKSSSSSNDESSSKEDEGTNTTASNQFDTSSMPDYASSAVKEAIRMNLIMAKPRSKDYKWKPNGEATNGIKFFIATSNSKKKGVAIKAVVPFISFPPSAVLKCLSMPFEDARAKKLNPDTQAMTILKRFDRHTILRHQKQHGIWPTTPRDVVSVIHVRKLDSGAIISCGRSVDSPEAPPENPSTFVRMNIYAAGWILEEAKDSSGRLGTRATYVNHFDAMGSIPKWVVKKGTTVALNQTIRLQKILEKDSQEFRAAETMTNETFEIYAPLATATTTENATKDDEEKEEEVSVENVEVIHTTQLPPAIASQVKTTLQNCLDMAKGSKYCKWLDFGDKGHIKCCISEDYAFKNEGIAVKGVIPFLPVSPSQVCNFLSLPQDDPRKRRLQPKVAESKRVHDYDKTTFLKYQRNIKAWGSTPRDMSVLVHIRTQENGTIAIVVSDLKSDLVPKNSSCVRMKVFAAGWFLEPCDSKDGSIKGTRATYVNHCDVIRGFIPLRFVKGALKESLDQLVRLESLIREDLKKNGVSKESSLKTQKLAQLQQNRTSSNNDDDDHVGPAPVPRQSIESRPASRRHRDSVLGVDDSCCSVFTTPSPSNKKRKARNGGGDGGMGHYAP